MFRKTDIPRPFYSEFTEAPFLKCIDCECDLHASEDVYTITKHYVQNEAVFEMAICLPCATKLREQYSQKSLDAIMGYIKQHVNAVSEDPVPPPAEDEEIPEITWEAAIMHCVFCQKSQHNCHRYEIMGGFMENQLLLQPGIAGSLGSPMMMCEDCNGELSKLLSKETRESWDRFVEDHFDGPPGIELDHPKMEPIFI